MSSYLIHENDIINKTCLEVMLERKKEIEIKKQYFQNEIKKLYHEVENIDKKLWIKCNHNWVLDSSCSSDDLCKRYCTICHLKNMKNLYT